jgi:hypothetical protein
MNAVEDEIHEMLCCNHIQWGGSCQMHTLSLSILSIFLFLSSATISPSIRATVGNLLSTTDVFRFPNPNHSHLTPRKFVRHNC